MLARQADPEGKRTIGVLTKVDTLRGMENDRWVKVLRGEREQLLHGYFVSHLEGLRAIMLKFRQRVSPTWTSCRQRSRSRRHGPKRSTFSSALVPGARLQTSRTDSAPRICLRL